MANPEIEQGSAPRNAEGREAKESLRPSEELSSLRREVELQISDHAREEVEHFVKSGLDAKERYILYMAARYLLNRPVKRTDSLEDLRKVFDKKAAEQIGFHYSYGKWRISGTRILGMDRDTRAEYFLHVFQLAKSERLFEKGMLTMGDSVQKFVDRFSFVFDAQGPKPKLEQLAQPRAGESPGAAKRRWVDYFLLKKFGGYADPLWDEGQMDDQVDNAFLDDLKNEARAGRNSEDEDVRKTYSAKALAKVWKARKALGEIYESVLKGASMDEREVLDRMGPSL